MTKKPREYPFHGGSDLARDRALADWAESQREPRESIGWWVFGVLGFYALVFGPVLIKEWPW